MNAKKKGMDVQSESEAYLELLMLFLKCDSSSFVSPEELQKKMGAIISIPADISSLEKQTIVNTRANKLRHAIEKFPVLAERRARSEPPLSRSECKHKALSVGFGSIVHERVYSNQEPPPSPSQQEGGDKMITRRRARFSTRLFTNMKGEDITKQKPVNSKAKKAFFSFLDVIPLSSRG